VRSCEKKHKGGDIFTICKKGVNERSEDDNNKVVTYMRNNYEVFKEIDLGEMAEVAGKFVPTEYRPGELICKANDDEDFVIILYEGTVNALKSKSRMDKESWLRHNFAKRMAARFLIKETKEEKAKEEKKTKSSETAEVETKK